MARKANIIAHVVDAYGDAWDVREKKDGPVEIVIGWPSGAVRGRGGGGPRVVPTTPLVEYLKSDRPRKDLPISASAIKSLVKKYKIVRDSRSPHLLNNDDRDKWWQDRFDDLLLMTSGDFSREHGVSHNAVLSRKKSYGLPSESRKPLWWWYDKQVRELLVGDSPISYIADKLRYSEGAVRRMRWMARKMQDDPDWRRKQAAKRRAKQDNSAADLSTIEGKINERIDRNDTTN